MNREPTMQDVANLSPVYIWLHRIVLLATAIMIVLAGIFSVVRAVTVNPIYFLLFLNIFISAVMTGLTNLWYRKGLLGMNNHWLLVVAGIVIIWQCIATDIYVFNAPAPYSTLNESLTYNWTALYTNTDTVSTIKILTEIVTEIATKISNDNSTQIL